METLNQNKYLRASFLFKLIVEKFGGRLFTGLERESFFEMLRKNLPEVYIRERERERQTVCLCVLLSVL
jgi:hypothetical protein